MAELRRLVCKMNREQQDVYSLGMDAEVPDWPRDVWLEKIVYAKKVLNG